ncbi:unnamed protein product [Lactuca virosa]|uniref:WD repeat-containing protein 26 n=1 Tax=Lactuca virosa TaxID=75947 RepID=A0AAU9PBT0_9ASTR|nr:unnamed protein product [Lactuca virosa]
MFFKIPITILVHKSDARHHLRSPSPSTELMPGNSSVDHECHDDSWVAAYSGKWQVKGYEKSAACLESESGISYKSAEFKLLESSIIGADWEGCIDSLYGIKNMTDEQRDTALFLVSQQCLLECLGRGDDSLALSLLRKQISKLQVGREKVHKLAFSLFSLGELGLDKVHDDCDVFQELRRNLVNELEKLLPPPITVPDRRLEHLVERVVGSQIDSCIYHNSLDPVSIYKNHSCGRDQIPTETIQILSDHKNEVWFVQFSNNGDYLASSSSDCTAIIWKIQEDGKLVLKHRLSSHQNPVSFVIWSPDDTMVLTCGNTEVLRLWDVETGTYPKKGICMWDCEGNEIKAWRGTRMPKVLDIAVTPNGEYLITIFSDKDIRILNVATNAERVISEEHPITSLSVSGDSKYLIVNLNSQEIHMWDVEGLWEKPLRYKGHRQHKYVIRSCFGGVNSTFIASGSENSQVYIWNRSGSDPIEVLSGHSMTVNCVSWNPRRHQMLASASDDQTIRIWGPNPSQKMHLKGLI